MNLDIGEEQRQLQDAIRKLFEKEATQPRIRAAETTGIDRELWAHVVAMGVPLLRVRDDAGGLGLGLFEAVLVAELAGRFMAPVPLLEVMTAAAVLGRIDTDAARTWLSHLADGSKIVTLALQDVGSTPRQIVPAGAVADAVLCLEGDVMVLVAATAARDSVAGEFGVLPVAPWDLAMSSPPRSRIELARGPAARARRFSPRWKSSSYWWRRCWRDCRANRWMRPPPILASGLRSIGRSAVSRAWRIPWQMR